MVKIRYLNILDINNLKKLVEKLTRDNFVSSSGSSLSMLSSVSYIIPKNLKFSDDTYIAEDEGEIKGIISLCPRRKNQNKWRIRRFLYDNEFSDIGKMLIDFVISKYSALGVETFEVEIDSDDNEIIDLFSKICGFRYCMDYQIFEVKSSYFKDRRIDTENLIFRPFKNSDKNDVADLYNHNISPYYKFSLSKSPKEFCDNLCKGLDKKEAVKFIVEDRFSKNIRGFLNILTEDNRHFFIETVILPSYENCLNDVISFAISQIYKKTANFSLYFKNCKFHSNSDIYEKILYNTDGILLKTDMIFVKDFFGQIKNDEHIKSASVMYNEINGKPAYKI